MRIPTFNMFTQQLSQVQNQYSNLNTLIQQEDTHQVLLEPSDDPVLASRISLTSNYINNLSSYTQNGEVANNRMQLYASSTSNAVTYIAQIKTLIQEAQNGTNSDDQRSAISLQLKGYLSNLLATANSQDSSGAYIYSGANTNIQPYTLQNGSYQYNGSFNTTNINIGPNASTIYNQSGYNFFGNIPLGNGSFTVAAATMNTGTGYTSSGSVTNTASYVADTYTIDFVTNSAGNTAYTVTGAVSGQVVPPLPDTVPNQAPDFIGGPNGSDITFNGVTLNVQGQPAVGDSFSIAPAPNQDIFDSLQSIISALQTPIGNDAAKLAQLQQVMTQSAATFTNAYSQMVSLQSQVGTMTAAVQNQAQQNANLINNESKTLINLSIVDPFQVASSITQQSTYLKASLSAYQDMQDVLMAIMKL